MRKRERRPPPDAHTRDHDLPLYDVNCALYRDASRNAIHAIAYLPSFFPRVAFTFENDALAFVELRDALT